LHFHVVFTIPSELRPLARFAAKRSSICSSRPLHSARSGRGLSAELRSDDGLALDTRSAPIHVHAIVTGGGLSLDGTRWIRTRQDSLHA
jgi:hypothetical protein